MKKLLILFASIFLLVGCDNKDINRSDNNNKTVTGAISQKTESSSKIEENNNSTAVLNDKYTVIRNYFNTALDTIKGLTTKDNIVKGKDKIKNIFVTMTDFLFYDGTINGVKLDEVTDTTKKYALNILSEVDNCIIKVWPNYKDTISTTTGKLYSHLQEEITSGINFFDRLLTNAYGEEKINNITKKSTEVKDNVIDEAKDAAITIKDKVTSWYNKIKEN